MRRRLAIALALLIAAPRAYGDPIAILGQGFSTRALQEFSQALTSDARFGAPGYATADLPTCTTTGERGIAADTTLHTLTFCNGTTRQTFAAGTGTFVTGTGTTNTLPKFTTGASGIIGNSDILDSTSGVTAASFAPTTLTLGGYVNAAPSSAIYSGVNATGSDIAGGATTINAGRGTGSAAASTLALTVAPNSTTGSSLNTAKTGLSLTGSTFSLGNVTINSGGTAAGGSIVQSYNGAGTDSTGGFLQINGGQSTGNEATGGYIDFRVSPSAVGSGSGQNSLARIMLLNPSGNIVIGNMITFLAPSGTVNLFGNNRSGADLAGQGVLVGGGQGTGTGASGTVSIQVAPNSTTSSTLNTRVTAATFAQNSYTLGTWDINSGGTAPAVSTIRGVDAAGTDIAGGGLTIGTGQGTGSSAAPSLTFQVAPNAGTGSSQSPLVTAAVFSGTGFTIGGTQAVSGGTAPAAVTVQGYKSAGSDVNGGSITIAPGNGTGAAAGSSANINRNLIRATSSTAQTGVNAITVCESKILSNTSATVTTLATIGLASNTAGGATVTITVTADDGTNFDAETQSANLSFVNKAGTFTVSTPTIAASSAANNSGSATIGFTATGASSLISLKVTPVFTTIVPTTVTAYIEVNNHSAGAVTCQ